MIDGEAPGRDEDRIGKGFVGDSGRELWKALEDRGIERDIIYVSNVVKCWPSQTKTPKPAHITQCRAWHERELRIVKPFVVLAFGNTCNKFYRDEDKGIMALNGTTEWNNKFGFWICWSIHPASVLYHRENKAMFEEALYNFADKVFTLGF